MYEYKPIVLCSTGMVKTFQLTNKGQYGASIKIAPITTETVNNEETCLQVNGTFDMKIQPQSIIPDTPEMEVKKYLSIQLTIYKYVHRKYIYLLCF